MMCLSASAPWTPAAELKQDNNLFPASPKEGIPQYFFPPRYVAQFLSPSELGCFKISCSSEDWYEKGESCVLDKQAALCRSLRF